jgi:hypothetical protein
MIVHAVTLQVQVYFTSSSNAVLNSPNERWKLNF